MSEELNNAWKEEKHIPNAFRLWFGGLGFRSIFQMLSRNSFEALYGVAWSWRDQEPGTFAQPLWVFPSLRQSRLPVVLRKALAYQILPSLPLGTREFTPQAGLVSSFLLGSCCGMSQKESVEYRAESLKLVLCSLAPRAKDLDEYMKGSRVHETPLEKWTVKLMFIIIFSGFH